MALMKMRGWAAVLAMAAASVAVTGILIAEDPAKKAKDEKPATTQPGAKTDQEAAPPMEGEASPQPPPGGKGSGAGEGKAEMHGDPEPRREPSYSEILKELQKESRREGKQVVTPGVRGIAPRVAQPAQSNALATPEAKLLPDGSRLVDRPGRLTREGEYFVFSFESRGTGEPELPIRLLPNRLLEDMEGYSENGMKPLVFVVSGEVTEYRGVNYLLIQKLLVRPSLGNLK